MKLSFMNLVTKTEFRISHAYLVIYPHYYTVDCGE